MTTSTSTPSTSTAAIAAAGNITSTVLSISLLAYDSAALPNDPLHIVAVQPGQNGTAILTPGGDVSFTPTPGYIGPASFSYTVADQFGATAQAQANVTVTPLVQPLSSGNPLQFGTAVDTPLSINADQLTGLAYSPIWLVDGSIQVLDHTVNISNATHGTVAIDNATGEIVFTPDPGFAGVATFTFAVNNVHPGPGTVVQVEVAPPSMTVSTDGHLLMTSAARDQLSISPSPGGFTVSAGAPATVQMGSGPDTVLAADGQIMLGLNDAIAGPVWRIYQAALDRQPDTTGFQAWMSGVQNGLGLQQVAQSFIASPEFQAKYGAQSDAQFVDQLYHNVLGRVPDPAGLAAWTDGLSHGLGREVVLLGFADSAENMANTVAHAGTDGYWVV